MATESLAIDCVDHENLSLLHPTSVAVNFKDPVTPDWLDALQISAATVHAGCNIRCRGIERRSLGMGPAPAKAPCEYHKDIGFQYISINLANMAILNALQFLHLVPLQSMVYGGIW